MFKKLLFLFIIFLLIISCRKATTRPTIDSMGDPPKEPNDTIIEEDTEITPEPTPEPKPESEFIIIATDTEEVIENKIQKYYEQNEKYIAFVEGSEEDIKQNNTLEKINNVIKKDIYSKGVSLNLSSTTITKIYDNTFYGNRYLTYVTLPETLTSIGNRAFADAAKLTFISFPSSLREIGNNAFEKCVSLGEVNLEYTEITTLNQYIFNECYNLSKVVLPYGLLSIGNNAFSYCTSLENITFPEKIQMIGEYAFFSCENLKKVNFNDGIQSIYYMAFDGCTSLSNISLPSSLKQIGITGVDVFSYTGLSKVEYLGTDPSAISCLGNIFGTTTNPKNLYLPNVDEPLDITIKDKWNKFLGYNWENKIKYKTSMPNN